MIDHQYVIPLSAPYGPTPSLGGKCRDIMAYMGGVALLVMDKLTRVLSSIC